ncbi:TRAP transporter small permease [Pseudorhodobacter turbinis]|uniref:TRAP transporter small permease protein n=1 Tax=Pseudorhodobacter turbinis TaxID=2500533 RepID=A0A4P8EDD8_9RHOB|nr:TRAP transporter small permease [Pseudorhodobacter turbinis]QCO54703.1 TRAP transporter small permease [Pseudorhodobacter turbinis]
MDHIFRKLTHGLMLVGGLGIFLMMANITLDVVFKVFWNAPIQGTVEISSYYYMVAIVMLPMAMVEYDDEQISVDLLFNHFPDWLKRASLLVTFLATAIMLSIMTWRTGLDAVRAFNVGEVVMGSREIIVWPARCMLPIGFGLAAVAAMLRAIMLLRGRAVTKLQDTGSAV